MDRARFAACLYLGLAGSLPGQEITLGMEGARRSFAIAPHAVDAFYPDMPPIPARWTGGPEAGNGPVLWQAEVGYTTRQRNPLALRDAFETQAMGSAYPLDLFRHPAPAGQRPPRTGRAFIRGGNLHLRALPGGLEGGLEGRLEGLGVRLGDQPEPGKVAERLGCGPETLPDGTLVDGESLTQWLRAIAAQESGLRQNAAGEAPAQYQALGEPNMNRHGDGGIGIMQRTPYGLERTARPLDIQDWLWDWTANVDEGKRLFREEKLRNSAFRYPAQVARSQGFARAVEATHRHREALGLPRLRRIAVTPFTAGQLLQDAVRGYNGYAGTDPFGLRLHEFRLRTHPTAFGPALEVTREGPDPEAAEHPEAHPPVMAWAVWERVPPADRPLAGDRAYVDHVRALLP